MPVRFKRFLTSASLLLLLALLCGCISPVESFDTRKSRYGSASISSVQGGSTYFVSTNGNDHNPGSGSKPWRTVGYASKKLKPGDTLIIRAGKYILKRYWEDMITPQSGTPKKWITIKGEGERRPVLAGRNNLLSAIDLGASGYVQIENLEITSDCGTPFRNGVEVVGGDRTIKSVILKNLYIHHIDEMAVDIGDVERFIIERCRFEYCGFGAIGGPPGMRGGIRNLTVRDCRLSYSGHYYRGKKGPSPYERPDGIGIEVSAGPVEIESTIAEHNRGDGIDSKACSTRVQRCVIANNTCDGVKLWGGESRVDNTLIYGTGDGAGGSSPWAGLVIDTERGGRFEIVNVTISDNPQRKAYPLYVQYGQKKKINLVFKNNIVSGGYGPAYFGDSAELLCENCLFNRGKAGAQVHARGRDYSTRDISAGRLGKRNKCADPLFKSPAWGKRGDYHLRKESPAIDSGSGNGAHPLDLDGRRRPRGAAWDIGAYEY